MYRQSDIGEWWLMKEFELDIPSLTSEGIQLNNNAFEVKELVCSSMIVWIANDWDADSLDQYIRQNGKYLLKIDKEYNNSTKRFVYEYNHDLSVFDTDILKGIERVEIESNCFTKVNRLVIDGLNELKSIIIGKKCFKFDKKIKGNKCIIMNCHQLEQIHIGYDSFYWYEIFELRNLPSLISIQLDDNAFHYCHSIAFESMSDWMGDEWDLNQLQSIILGTGALAEDGYMPRDKGDISFMKLNELIMRSMNDNDDWLTRSSFSIYIQRNWM